HLIARDVRTNRAIKSQHRSGAAAAATQIDNTQRPIGNVAGQPAWNGPPVGPILARIDGGEILIGQGRVSSGDGSRLGGPEADSPPQQTAFPAPLPPACRQNTPRPVPAH